MFTRLPELFQQLLLNSWCHRSKCPQERRSEVARANTKAGTKPLLKMVRHNPEKPGSYHSQGAAGAHAATWQFNQSSKLII